MALGQYSRPEHGAPAHLQKVPAIARFSRSESLAAPASRAQAFDLSFVFDKAGHGELTDPASAAGEQGMTTTVLVGAVISCFGKPFYRSSAGRSMEHFRSDEQT